MTVKQDSVVGGGVERKLGSTRGRLRWEQEKQQMAQHCRDKASSVKCFTEDIHMLPKVKSLCRLLPLVALLPWVLCHLESQ